MHFSRRRFITRSSYEGAWNNALQMMDGLGTYHYPDGSEYRGFFKRGRFHGYGRIKLAAPYKFTVKGTFEDGTLVEIEDMWFNDDLHLKGTFLNGKLGTKEWQYLTTDDRRYAAEMRYGLQPVGPTSYLTNQLNSRRVPDQCYDIEEGMFIKTNSWVTDRPKPLTKSTFLGCIEERKWIIKNCRGATRPFVHEPSRFFCRQIMRNNLNAEKDLLETLGKLSPTMDLDRKRYFEHLCKKSTKDETKDEERVILAEEKCEVLPDTSSDAMMCPQEFSSDEVPSFTEDSLQEDIEKMCLQVTRERRNAVSVHDFRVVQSNLFRPPNFHSAKSSLFPALKRI